MTPTETQILALLARRREIDRTPDGSFTGNSRWLIEATELLLRHQLELREELRLRLGSVSPPDAPWWDSTRAAEKLR